MRFAVHAPRGFLHYLFAFLFITLLALAMTECPSLGNPGRSSQVEAAAPDSEIVLVVMPKGDAAAGRQAFHKLGCDSCHAVPSDPAMKGAEEKSGPDLGQKRASYSNGYEVTSILSPTHIVAFQYSRKQQDVANMPDLTADMSVKQLIDIMAYLRSVGPR